MKKYSLVNILPDDQKLKQLLAQRKAPLSQEGLQLALTDLTLYLTGDILYACVLYPKKEMYTEAEISVSDIDKADLMVGSDDQLYLPVFTDMDLLLKFKPKMQKGEAVYLLKKEDLLRFLQNNEKVSACVVNPMTDDLLLYRIQLQNMIAMQNNI